MSAEETTVERIWNGAPAFEPFLVEIASLEPFPGNPRRGDVASVMGSLGQFGQKKLSVVVDGKRIVAGHHVVLAATELGWTHVAATPVEFISEEEQRGFMLADNRTSDLGSYDRQQLVEHMKILAEADSLAGTGYSTDDLDAYLAELRRISDDPVLPVEPPTDDDPIDLREVVLLYSPKQRDQLEAWLKTVSLARGTDGLSQTIYTAAELAAVAVQNG